MNCSIGNPISERPVGIYHAEVLVLPINYYLDLNLPQRVRHSGFHHLRRIIIAASRCMKRTPQDALRARAQGQLQGSIGLLRRADNGFTN
jgi:hypothetical protein